jgi:hypothetical protein
LIPSPAFVEHDDIFPVVGGPSQTSREKRSRAASSPRLSESGGSPPAMIRKRSPERERVQGRSRVENCGDRHRNGAIATCLCGPKLLASDREPDDAFEARRVRRTLSSESSQKLTAG